MQGFQYYIYINNYFYKILIIISFIINWLRIQVKQYKKGAIKKISFHL